MFIIDLRNKFVSDNHFSVIGNNNVDKVRFLSHFTQYSNYSIYLKVKSEDETYVDKIEIASENISVDEDMLVVDWTMGKVSTQCKKIYVQLQFENDEGELIAQSRIVNIILNDTIDVSEEMKRIYPDILIELQNQIDTLSEDSVANISVSYSNDVLTINLYNSKNKVIATKTASIPLDTHIADKNNPHEVTKAQVGLGNVDNTSDLNKPVSTATQNELNKKLDKVDTESAVYGTDYQGHQTMYDVDDYAGADGSIVRRSAQSGHIGQIIVPLTPIDNTEAGSKGYIDAFAKVLIVSIDSSTYVMTFTLKDKNNNTLSTQTIDLPLETMVVGGSYDNVNKKIILTLKNGQTIDIPVADLIDGLVSTTQLTNTLLNYYTKAQIEAGYYSSESVSNLSTMGELRTFIDNINSQGKHCFFDLHNYVNDAYVCIVHMWTENGVKYCFVQDLINHKTYGDYAGYNDATTIATYLSSNAMANIKVIKITDANTTLNDVAELLQEINGLHDYVMFDVAGITSAMYLTTIYINGSYYRVFDSVTGRTASGTSSTGLSETLKAVIEGGVVEPSTWEEIHNLIAEGNIGLVYGAGDEIDVKFYGSFSVVSSNSDLTVTCDRDVFVLKTSMTAQTAVFTYNSNRSTWVYSENDVNIAEYGITVTGTPANGNTITVTMTVNTVPHIVMGNDQEVAGDNDSFTHSLTLRRKYARDSGYVFDPREAFFYNGTDAPLPAGTYNFLLGNHSWYSADIGKYFQFTLTEDLPVGGQLVWQQAYNATLVNASIKVFASPETPDANPTETVTMTEGQGGTYLGVINNGFPTSGTTGYDATYNKYLNQCQRALFGSNDYATSNIRQKYNSNQVAGTYAEGKTGWDRLAGYLTSENGFIYDLDPNVKMYLAECKKTTETVTFTSTAPTSGGRKQSNEKVWLMSREEIQSESASEYNSYPSYTYYHNLLGSTYGDWRTDTRFILTNAGGTAQYYFLRSPYASSGCNVRYVDTCGTVSTSGASYGDCRAECFALK